VEASPGPRWVIPSEDGLLLAVGRAVYGFAQLERSVERLRQGLPAMLGGHFAGLSPEQALTELEASSSAAGEAPEDGLRVELVRLLRRYCGLKAWRDGLLGLQVQRDASPAEAALCGGPAQGDEPPVSWHSEAVSRMARNIEITAAETNYLLRRHF